MPFFCVAGFPPKLFFTEEIVTQTVSSRPEMWETWVWSLGWEDPWRRKWQPMLLFLPGKSHEWSRLEGYSPWGCKEWDTTEWLQFSSVAQSRQTLCDPMNRSTPGLSVHHQLLEFTQTHVHWVGDAIQPSHPLLFRSPPALNLSQHQCLFKWVSSSHQVASASTSVLPMNIQDSFPLWWTGWISLQSKGLSRVFSNTTVQKHEFFSTQLSL